MRRQDALKLIRAIIAKKKQAVIDNMPPDDSPSVARPNDVTTAHHSKKAKQQFRHVVERANEPEVDADETTDKKTSGKAASDKAIDKVVDQRKKNAKDGAVTVEPEMDEYMGNDKNKPETAYAAESVASVVLRVLSEGDKKDAHFGKDAKHVGESPNSRWGFIYKANKGAPSRVLKKIKKVNAQLIADRAAAKDAAKIAPKDTKPKKVDDSPTAKQVQSATSFSKLVSQHPIPKEKLITPFRHREFVDHANKHRVKIMQDVPGHKDWDTDPERAIVDTALDHYHAKDRKKDSIFDISRFTK